MLWGVHINLVLLVGSLTGIDQIGIVDAVSICDSKISEYGAVDGTRIGRGN
jgi:hypothetical protein